MAIKLKTRELPTTPPKARPPAAGRATSTAPGGVTGRDAFAKRTPTLSDYAGAKPFAADPKPIVDFVRQAANGIGGFIDQVKGVLSEYDPKLAGLTALKGVVVAGANFLEQHLPGLGPATKAIEDFINTPPPSAQWPDPPPPVSANPALPGGEPRVYASTDGMPLWGESGPQVPADVRQGKLGDCYFMASLAGLDAKAVQDMVRDNKDGTYTVRLYDVDSDGRATPKFVTVTGDLPEPAAALYGPDGKWAAIVEKAYAVQVGGYDTAAGDNNPKFFAAPTVLAGRPTVAYALPVSDPDVVFARLEQATADHRPAFTGTYAEDADGVLPSHAYTVVDTRTDPATGERYVVLRNPWGNTEPTDASGAPRDGKDDGVFEMKLDDFMKTYQAVAIAGG
ncbi:MAG: C2 family cysteine protease [Myxococcaceae bacterium]